MKKFIFLALSLVFILSIKDLQAYKFDRLTVVGSSSDSPVIGSLLRGLDRLGIRHDFNNWSDPGDVMYVNSDLLMLQKGIHLRQQGRIKKLIAGPNLVIRAIDHGGIIGNQAIDLYLVNSHWTRRAYVEDMPRLESHIGIWWAGVDENDWIPAEQRGSKKILVYWKNGDEKFCTMIEKAIRDSGFEPIRVKYGTYKKPEYKAYLNNVSAAVFISMVESQGIALLEAWAMNIPTFAWNPQDFKAYGKIYTEVSSCPYLTEKTGRDWKTIDELKTLLSKFADNQFSFSPRNWVENHMTDVHSAKLMLEYIDCL